MIGLNNSIYATLFPHLRKQLPIPIVPQPNRPSGDDDPAMETGENFWNDPAPYAEATGQVQPTDDAPPMSAAPEEVTSTAPAPPPTVSAALRDPRTPTASAFDASGVESKIAKTDLAQAQEDYAAIAKAPAKKQAAWKQALWMALQGANKYFNPQDRSEVTWLGEAKKNNQMIRAGRRLAPLQAAEQQRIQSQQEQMKTAKGVADFQGVMLANEGKVIANATAKGKQDYETLMKKGYITPEEAAEYKKRNNGLEINPFDARTYETRYENGNPYAIPKIGVPTAVLNPTLPVRQREREVPVNIGDSQGVTTSEKGLTMKVNAEKDNLGRAVRVEENNQRATERQETRQYNSEKELANDIQSWTQRQTAAKSKLASAEKKLANYQANKVAGAGYNTDAIDKQIAELEGDIEGAKTALQEPRPKGVVVPQNIKRKDAGKVIKIPKKDSLGIF